MEKNNSEIMTTNDQYSQQLLNKNPSVIVIFILFLPIIMHGLSF